MLVGAAALAALAERLYALGNERRLLRAGGREIAPSIFRLMVPVYSAVFIAGIFEHLRSDRRPGAGWAIAMTLLFLLAKALKIWAVLQLREGWTMKVVIPPELRAVSSGPYRYIRHPNYVAVMVEIVTLPLAGGAWRTAIAAGALFAIILVFRVRAEEAALMRHPAYVRAMGRKRRFIPGRERD